MKNTELIILQTIILIYKATSNQELVDFVSSPVPLCKFCGMPVKEPAKWQLSKRDKDEWIFTDKYF